MNLPFALNPALESLPIYHPGRPIEEVARELRLPARGIIKLASNENPFGPSPLALAALKSAVKKIGLYPDGNAFYLKQKLAAHLGVAPSNLVLGNGSNDIIEFLAHALLAPGTNAVMSEYCFAIYPLVTRLLGATPVFVPAKKYGHDLPAMVKAITPSTKAIFIANPNNPTGTLVPSDEVLAFLEQVPPHVVIIMDEAYIEFLENPLDLIPKILGGTSKLPPSKIPIPSPHTVGRGLGRGARSIRRGQGQDASKITGGEKPNLILLRTFSKIYGLAGLRLGYGIAHPAFIAALEKIRQPFNVNSLSQAAGIAALDDTAHVQKTRQNNFLGLKFMSEALHELGIEYIPSHANFLLAQVGEGQRVFAALQSKGIIVRPMQGYGLPEWIRISIGLPRENHRFVRTLKSILRPKK